MEKLLLESEKSISLCKKDALHQVAVDKMSSKLSAQPLEEQMPGSRSILEVQSPYTTSGTSSRAGSGERRMQKHLCGPRWLS